jgi:hypothetical protein
MAQDTKAALVGDDLIGGGCRRMVLMVVLVMLALVVPGGPARAGTPDPCADIDGRWRTTGHDQAHTTSRCIGNPITPQCAIETLDAVFLRGDVGLLASVAAPGFARFDDDWADMNAKDFSKSKYFYRIVLCRVLTADDRPLTGWGRVRPGVSPNRDYAWYPGDVLLEDEFELCDIKQSRASCFKKSPDHGSFIRILRRLDTGHWRLVDWDSWDNIFPIQGHVGPPCRPEDQGLRFLTGDAATTTSHCLDSNQTPLCTAETYLKGVLAGERDRHGHSCNSPLFLRYKILDCEVLDDQDPDPDRWDPRPYGWPMVRGEKIGMEGWGRGWKAGDVRLGIRMQVCNGADNTCQPTEDMIEVYHRYPEYWASVGHSGKENISKDLK